MTRRGLLLASAAAVAAHADADEKTVTISPDKGPSLEDALARGATTVILLPGIYPGLRIRTANVTVRAAEKWKAVVLGSREHGVSIEAPSVTLDGLEVAGSRIDGIKASADAAVIRNCWVHNNSAQGVAIHGRKGWTIERNLIEFNGQHPQLQHGIYADGEAGIVRANVVRHNSGYGVQLYPAMRGVTVANNLIHGHSTKGGIVLAAPAGRNLLVNNTIADNAYGIRLMGGEGQVIANNIVVGAGEAVSLADAESSSGPAHAQPVVRNNLIDDPKFLDRGRQIYFLAPGSPAIGKASPDDAPATDFWGRGRPADLGAFPFLAALAPADARASWHNGWPYRFSSTDPRMEMPDLWAL